VVRHSGEAVREDRRRTGVVVCDPGELAAKDGVHGQVEAGVAAANTPDPDGGHFRPPP